MTTTAAITLDQTKNTITFTLTLPRPQRRPRPAQRPPRAWALERPFGLNEAQLELGRRNR